MRISLAHARRLALRGQGLDGSWKLPAGKDGAAEAVRRLGYVQIDTIAVVQRAHHHTLWTRRGDYRPEMLDELQGKDRRVFECWGHAAAYAPTEHYRYYVRRMPRWWEDASDAFLARHGRLAREVLQRIEREGPLGSSDFKHPTGRKRGPWWDWKPAKKALEALFSRGELMVTRRRNFERLYDLPERVLPADVDTSPPTARRRRRFVIDRTLRTQGVSSLRHWSVNRDALDPLLTGMIDAGEVAELTVAGLDGRPHYATPEALDATARASRRKSRLHILSPFDALVRWRGRVRELFGLDYKLECYTPAANRRWGYFCLPLLWGDRFIGRADCKADRKPRDLLVRSLLFESGFDGDDALDALAARLRDFAGFNDCDQVVLETVRPAKLKAPLSNRLR